MAVSAHSLLLQLLPTPYGQPVQSWEFVDSKLIHIGRSSECDVVINSPVVSRSHAYLNGEGTGWELCCVSQNGIFIDGSRVQSVQMTDDVVFRLASTGPFLRFRELQEGRCQSMETIPPDDCGMPPLLLDETKRDQQVSAIADGEYFQELQSLAQQLRNQTDT